MARGQDVAGKRRRGRQKRKCLDNIRNDLSEKELSREEAQDRVKWRRLIRNIDPTYKWERMRKKNNIVWVYSLLFEDTSTPFHSVCDRGINLVQFCRSLLLSAMISDVIVLTAAAYV